MQQISLPFRIAIGAILAFGVVWFAVLRPGPDPTPAPAPLAPGVAGLTKDVGGANAAVSKANASAGATLQAADAVDSGTAAGRADAAPATDATAKPGVTKAAPAATAKSKNAPAAAKPASGASDLTAYIAHAGPAKSLVRALVDDKVVIMVFKNASSDSGVVERAARTVAKRSGGQIRLRVTDIKNVGKYTVFTEKTQIAQAPTTLIIAPNKRARTIVGFTTIGEISEAAMRLDGGLQIGGVKHHARRRAAHKAAAKKHRRAASKKK